ncbi:MAG: DUF5668 domain-containing protein [Patescibacteria group bacterium]
MFFASLLVILGVVFLLKNLGIISGDVWGVIWPLLIIALGVSMFYKRRGVQWWCNTDGERHKTIN